MNVYIHIPFCTSKCAYCAFLSHRDLAYEDKYIEAVCEEIAAHYSCHSEQGEESMGIHGTGSFATTQDDSFVDTIYFGGGTPSHTKPANINRVVAGLRASGIFAGNVEITLESNPSDITLDKLKSWHKAGVTRLSIGVQSLNDEVRRAVGRKLSSRFVLKKIILAKKYFKDVGIDLICGLPGETKESLLLGINSLTEFGVNHISLYDLETDNESEIAKNPNKYLLPADEQRSEMLILAWQRLASLGYEQYEISNFAKGRNYCRHNLDFWHGKDYLGFGLGAVSRAGNRVIENTKDFGRYCKGENITETEILSESELFNQEIIAKMRLNEPISQDLLLKLNDSLEEAKVEKLIGTDNKITLQGKLFNNYLIKKFVKDIQ